MVELDFTPDPEQLTIEFYGVPDDNLSDDKSEFYMYFVRRDDYNSIEYEKTVGAIQWDTDCDTMLSYMSSGTSDWWTICEH
jgi:hypothetical protein